MSAWTRFGEFKQRMRRQVSAGADTLNLLDDIATHRVDLGAGEKLYLEGDEGVPVFCVEKGWLIGLSYLGQGRRFVHRVYQKGDIVGLEDIIAGRLGRKVIGFGQNPSTDEDEVRSELLDQADVDDIMEFGLIPELLGRLPVMTTLSPLTEDALVQVLTEPKNALVRQYKKLFEMEECELEFSEGALYEIARRARIRDTGARGLRSIVEKAMFDIMYQLPEQERGQTFRITEEMVRGEQSMLPGDSAAA